MTRTNRRRSVLMTASLAGVLIALAGYVIHGTLNTTRATEQQSKALVVDMLFVEARIAVAMQEVNLRHYQLEPSVAVEQRFHRIAQSADQTLADIAETGDAQVRQKAERLRGQQATYRRLAVELIAMVADSDPGAGQLDRLEVTPAFFSLQNDVDEISRAYHVYAQEQVAELRRTQVRLLAGTAVGFTLGLALVAMILKMVLGYQRRLVDHAAENQHRALHDPLTGLPNRALFHRELAAALAGAKLPVAMMVIDLDGFKAVNDTLGHHAGDQLLIEAGRRLRDEVGDQGIVARLGGDEFAVLLPRSPGPVPTGDLAERLVAELSRDFTLNGRSATISGSLGIAFGSASDDGDELFRHADAAMYRAKSGGGGVAVHTPGRDTDEPNRTPLFADLRTLLDSDDPAGQLQMHYQPQLRLADGTVRTAEALVRWQHPARGTLLPASFLPLAERHGLEIPLTHHLMSVAVRQASTWLSAGHGYRVSVNVSAAALHDDFARRVLVTLRDEGLPPHLLRLELTETNTMADPEQATKVLRELSSHGVTVSIDDFGIGYNTLDQLRMIPADELKIDRTFVRDLRDGTPDAVIARSSIDLGHGLGLEVVAEGVEDLTTLAALRQMNCDYAQGYALSPPVPAADFPKACAHAEAVAFDAFSRTEPHERPLNAADPRHHIG